MVNQPKRNRKPVLRYTDVPKWKTSKAQRGITKIPVDNVLAYSPVLVSEETDFTKILGGEIDTALHSSSSTSSYKPSTLSSNFVAQDSGMPTSSQLSTIAKKKNHISKSKTPTPMSTNRSNEPGSSLTNLLQELNKDEVDHSYGIIQEDSQGSYIKMTAILCWEKIPTLHFRGPVVMWSTLMLALENPYMISTKRLKVGNKIHWHIPRLCLQDFSFDGICLTDNQISCALEFLELVFTTWSNPRSAIGPEDGQSMTLVGNLVLSGSKVVYHQRLHHMPKYIEWLLRVMYSVGDKTPEEYAQRESLLWECVFLGLVFPYSIGIKCVNFLPVDESPFLPFAFRWLPSVWLIYTAVAKVLIQLRLCLEAIAT
ncbi:hypothetical protein DSO57_1000883 [Entomophthora muscae]|uniref:Uncharacterized protein n=1 Tax=Entomophthora muscae TaxID=34485 RepID=A0ACC2SYE2_9FUNG|nr:hypothetical protein DSO57_1000883 [Entomophthora muscae]